MTRVIVVTVSENTLKTIVVEYKYPVLNNHSSLKTMAAREEHIP